MPKRTIADICATHGITKSVWEAAKTAGVNTWNDAEMAAHLAAKRHRTPQDASLGDAPDWSIPDDASPERALELLEMQVRRATSKNDTSILKEKIASLRQSAAARADLRGLIPVGEVKDSIVRIVSAARAELLKLTSDIPPQVEGLGAAEIQKILKAEVTAILARLSNDCEKAY